jgi:hypothetical protein
MRRRALPLGYRGKIRPVVITHSEAQGRTRDESRGRHWVVPKVDIVSSISVLQQSKMLVLPPGDETQYLLREMADFKMRYNKRTAHVAFGAVPGAHDDLVIALGLGCWWVLRFGVKRLAMVC